MSDHIEVVESLKKTGYRLTPQRMMILNVLEESVGHLEVDEIHERVRQQYPFVDLATVYRTLHLLKKLHLVTEISLGDVSRYEMARKDRHNHMVCSVCGIAYDLHTIHLDQLKQTLDEEYGFDADLEHFAVSGVCANCRNGQASS